MSKCEVCGTSKCPQNEFIKSLEKDKNTIRKASDNNKKFYRKVIVWLAGACGVLLLEVIFTLAYGKEGVTMLIDLAKYVMGKFL